MSAQTLDAYDRIVLMGFMGSGKSTVGKLLAERLGWTFCDLDSAVEQRCGLTVPRIFAKYGEQRFRMKESAALQELIDRTQLVLALGGGAVEQIANQELLRSSSRCAVIYLEAPFAQLQERCIAQARQTGTADRPLLADTALAEVRFASRQPVYQALATTRLNTSDRTPEQVTDAILQQLR